MDQRTQSRMDLGERRRAIEGGLALTLLVAALLACGSSGSRRTSAPGLPAAEQKALAEGPAAGGMAAALRGGGFALVSERGGEVDVGVHDGSGALKRQGKLKSAWTPPSRPRALDGTPLVALPDDKGGRVAIIDVEALEVVSTLTLPKSFEGSGALQAQWLAGGRRLLVHRDKGTALAVDPVTGVEAWRANSDLPPCVSSRGDRVATADLNDRDGGKKEVVLHDAVSGASVGRVSLERTYESFVAMALSEDGKRLSLITSASSYSDGERFQALLEDGSLEKDGQPYATPEGSFPEFVTGTTVLWAASGTQGLYLLRDGAMRPEPHRLAGAPTDAARLDDGRLLAVSPGALYVLDVGLSAAPAPAAVALDVGTLRAAGSAPRGIGTEVEIRIGRAEADPTGMALLALVGDGELGAQAEAKIRERLRFMKPADVGKVCSAGATKDFGCEALLTRFPSEQLRAAARAAGTSPDAAEVLGAEVDRRIAAYLSGEPKAADERCIKGPEVLDAAAGRTEAPRVVTAYATACRGAAQAQSRPDVLDDAVTVLQRSRSDRALAPVVAREVKGLESAKATLSARLEKERKANVTADAPGRSAAVPKDLLGQVRLFARASGATRDALIDALKKRPTAEVSSLFPWLRKLDDRTLQAAVRCVGLLYLSTSDEHPGQGGFDFALGHAAEAERNGDVLAAVLLHAATVQLMRIMAENWAKNPPQQIPYSGNYEMDRMADALNELNRKMAELPAQTATELKALQARIERIESKADRHRAEVMGLTVFTQQ